MILLLHSNISVNSAGHLTFAGFDTVSDKMHEAFHLLDEVRALLDDAKDALEIDAEAAAKITVELV